LCCFEWFQNKLSKLYFDRYVLELCCFEWFQNLSLEMARSELSFRAVLFRMVPKPDSDKYTLYREF
ncbi:hypothetical protein, partial [Streptococcus thermophilus]|uniref:hypothetical protein n=1 Tax=Streptococcus thermophilus TaxID=1308 RepID=UPI003BB6C8AF